MTGQRHPDRGLPGRRPSPGTAAATTSTARTGRPDDISIGPLASTMKACTDDALQTQEQHYLAALQLAKTYRIRGDQLELQREGGTIAVDLRARRNRLSGRRPARRRTAGLRGGRSPWPLPWLGSVAPPARGLYPVSSGRTLDSERSGRIPRLRRGCTGTDFVAPTDAAVGASGAPPLHACPHRAPRRIRCSYGQRARATKGPGPSPSVAAAPPIPRPGRVGRHRRRRQRNARSSRPAFQAPTVHRRFTGWSRPVFAALTRAELRDAGGRGCGACASGRGRPARRAPARSP